MHEELLPLLPLLLLPLSLPLNLFLASLDCLGLPLLLRQEHGLAAGFLLGLLLGHELLQGKWLLFHLPRLFLILLPIFRPVLVLLVLGAVPVLTPVLVASLLSVLLLLPAAGPGSFLSAPRALPAFFAPRPVALLAFPAAIRGSLGLRRVHGRLGLNAAVIVRSHSVFCSCPADAASRRLVL
uniref:Uncharacterized protein n=1 Tax=Ixodes ricinus TaxID=34613 RepID=A0A6B0UZL9_IXORI